MRTLIIKLGALGDVVMATSLIRAIQSQFPDDDLCLLTTPPFVDLFAGWNGLRVQAFPRKGAMWRMLRWMRSQQFDRVFDLQSNDRTALLMTLSGVRQRIGNKTHFPYTHHPHEVWRGQSHIFERMNQVLASAGVEAAQARPHLPPTDEDKARVSVWLQQHALRAHHFVVMHAGASPNWPSKRWPHFARLAQALEGRGLRVVWLGAGDDAPINRRLTEFAGVDASNEFSVRELAELGRNARFALANDSGPMHILAASGIPVYGFFGPTDWTRNHALGHADRVLRYSVACSPCKRGVCPPAYEHACLEGLDPDFVVERLHADGMLW